MAEWSNICQTCVSYIGCISAQACTALRDFLSGRPMVDSATLPHWEERALLAVDDVSEHRLVHRSS